MVTFAELKHKKEQWYSKPFLACNEGYQLCLRVDADGVGDDELRH